MKKLLILLFSLLIFSSPSVFADDLYVDIFAPELDFTLSDFCHEQPGVQERNGVFYFPNEEVGITATSICVFKDAFGQYRSQGKIKNGKYHGKWTSWYDNGQKEFEGIFKDGIPYNNIFRWSKDGQITGEMNLIDGNQIGSLYTYYDNGQLQSEEHYKNDESDGKFSWWYENGQIELEVIFKEGECISGDCSD